MCPVRDWGYISASEGWLRWCFRLTYEIQTEHLTQISRESRGRLAASAFSKAYFDICCTCAALFRWCSHTGEEVMGAPEPCCGKVWGIISMFLKFVSQDWVWEQIGHSVMYNKIWLSYRDRIFFICNSWVFLPKLPWRIEKGNEYTWNR